MNSKEGRKQTVAAKIIERKPHQRLTLGEKLEVIDLFESGKKQASIVKSLGLSKTLVSRIIKSSSHLKLIRSDKSVPLKSKKAVSMSKFPELDEEVYRWFVAIQYPSGGCKPLPLTREMIKIRAKEIAESRGLSEFKASDGWFRNWRWRFDIGKGVTLQEAGDVVLAESESQMKTLRLQLAEYNPEHVFNMDKTGLFYRCMPNQSYVYDGGDAMQIGTEKLAMKAKDLITLVLCVNATGTCKVDPLVIGATKNPKCFRAAPCPLPYTDQNKACMDKERYRHWWLNVFLPCVRKFTKDKVALTMDSCPGHEESCVDPLGQVKIFFFPSNVTSIYQPLHQGIIVFLKTRYKSRMFAKMITAYDNYDALQIQAARITNGKKGLSYGYPAHILDAATLVKACWDEMPVTSIVECWKRAKCFPIDETTELLSNHLEYSSRIQTEAVREICDLISGFPFDSVLNQKEDRLEKLGLSALIELSGVERQKMLGRWMNLEQDPEIVAASFQENLEKTVTDQQPAQSITSFSLDSSEFAVQPVELVDAELSTTSEDHVTLLDDESSIKKVMETAKHMMQIAKESKNSALIQITSQNYLRLRTEIEEKFSIIVL